MLLSEFKLLLPTVSITHSSFCDSLCSAVNEGEVPLEFASIECSVISIAKEVISTIRNRSNGIKMHGGAKPMHERDRAHFFLRIIVHQQKGKETMMSSVCIADLIGSSSSESSGHHHFDEIDRIHRREVSLQLQSLAKVLKEMKILNRRSIEPSPYLEKTPSLTLTSSRESKLASILAPIIQGNYVTTIWMFLVNDARHYHLTRSTLLALEGVTEIVCAVYRTKNVPLAALKLRHYDTVLPPIFPPPKTATLDDHLNEFADMNLEQLASTDNEIMYLHDKELPQLEDKPVASSKNPRLEQIMGEFHNLMAKLDNRTSKNSVIDDDVDSRAERIKQLQQARSVTLEPNKLRDIDKEIYRLIELQSPGLIPYRSLDYDPREYSEQSSFEHDRLRDNEDDDESVDSLAKTIEDKPPMDEDQRLIMTRESSGIGSSLPDDYRPVPITSSAIPPVKRSESPVISRVDEAPEIRKRTGRRSHASSQTHRDSSASFADGRDSLETSHDDIKRLKKVQDALMEALRHEREEKSKLEDKFNSMQVSLLPPS